MMGSFITRGLVMVLGYAYPAYECFKAVEKNKPEIEQLLFWCQYWILVAVLTVFERIGDNFVSWLPLYGEAKLVFFVYLWYPRTKGTTYIYETFFRPYLAKHEPEIDRNLFELRTRAGDVAVLYFQRAATYGQTRVFEILQFVAARSSAAPPPTKRQPQPSQPGPFQPVAPTSRQPPVKPQQNEPANSSASQQQPAPPAKEPPNQAAQATTSTNQPSKQQLPPPPSVHHPVQSQLQPPQRTLPIRSNSGTSEALATKLPPITGNAEKTDAESTLASDEDPNASVSEDVIMEDTIRMTRARLRRARKQS